MLGRFRHHQGMFWTPELKAQSKHFNTVINEISLNAATQDGTLRLEKKILFNRYAKNRRKRHEELKRLQFDELCKTGNRGQFFRFVKKLRRPLAASSLNPSAGNGSIYRTTGGRNFLRESKKERIRQFLLKTNIRIFFLKKYSFSGSFAYQGNCSADADCASRRERRLGRPPRGSPRVCVCAVPQLPAHLL